MPIFIALGMVNVRAARRKSRCPGPSSGLSHLHNRVPEVGHGGDHVPNIDVTAVHTGRGGHRALAGRHAGPLGLLWHRDIL
jgi:hypothetical protein